MAQQHLADLRPALEPHLKIGVDAAQGKNRRLAHFLGSSVSPADSGDAENHTRLLLA